MGGFASRGFPPTFTREGPCTSHPIPAPCSPQAAPSFHGHRPTTRPHPSPPPRRLASDPMGRGREHPCRQPGLWVLGCLPTGLSDNPPSILPLRSLQALCLHKPALVPLGASRESVLSHCLLAATDTGGRASPEPRVPRTFLPASAGAGPALSWNKLRTGMAGSAQIVLQPQPGEPRGGHGCGPSQVDGFRWSVHVRPSSPAHVPHGGGAACQGVSSACC